MTYQTNTILFLRVSDPFNYNSLIDNYLQLDLLPFWQLPNREQNTKGTFIFTDLEPLRNVFRKC